MSNYLLLFITVFVASCAQLLLKKGIVDVGGIYLTGDIINEILKIFKTPYIILGIFIYGIAMILTLLSLSRVELGVFALFTSLSYVIILAASYIFFNEAITIHKALGAILIIAGVYIILN